MKALNNKELNSDTPIEELSQIRGQIFMLTMNCQHIIHLIDELELAPLGEFEDAAMSLQEMGLEHGEQFECVQQY